MTIWCEAAVCVRRLVRLTLLFDGDLQKEHLDRMFGHLQEKVTWLTERPYLPDHVAFRILTLLKSLTEVGLSACCGQRCLMRMPEFGVQTKAVNHLTLEFADFDAWTTRWASEAILL